MNSEKNDDDQKKTCTCKNCKCSKSDKDKEKSQKVAAFKEKTDFSRMISDKNLENLSVPDKKFPQKRNYQITITDTGTNDGYFIEYSKEITVFEFGLILSEIFGMDVDVDYDDLSDASLGGRSIVFESFDDMIDFLDSQRDDDE